MQLRVGFCLAFALTLLANVGVYLLAGKKNEGGEIKAGPAARGPP